MSRNTALIDGDVIAYRFAASAETLVNWDGDIWTTHANLAEATAKATAFIEQVKADTECTESLIYFSQGPLYRNEVWPAYKSNRKGKRKPILLGKLIDWFKFESDFLTHWIPGLEADDLLGMGGYRRADTVICTIDKDLHTVEGFHYNWDKPELGVTMGSAYDASLQFYTQCLTGDSVDGFPGCPTVGPKTAAKILDGSESSDEMWQRVVATYEKKGLAEADAIVQARCAYILKLPNDIDEKGNVNLWTP